MEMATQTKTKAKLQKRATTKKQTTVRTATGNGNLYTKNIYTIKEQEYRITRFNKSTTKFVAAKQNNETEIKFSQYKNQRKHLKIFINLSIKFILCISQVNKSIFKNLTTKTHTNYKYKCNNSAKCIINSQQQEQQKLQKKSQCFKTISSKIQIVTNFLTKCNIKTKIVINHIRHFVGICLKRLISLKRLQQIPVTHNSRSKESLISIQIKIRTYKCVNFKEELNHNNELKFKFINEIKLSSENCQLNKESLKALISLQRKQNRKNVKEIQNHKNCQECFKRNCQTFAKDCYNIQTHKNLDLERPAFHRKVVYKSILFSTSQSYNYGDFFTKFYKKLFKKRRRRIDQINAENAFYSEKCCQLNKQRVSLQFIMMYTDQRIASRTTIFAPKNNSLNNSEIKTHQLALQCFKKHNTLLKGCSGKELLMVACLILESRKILKYCKELKNIKILQLLLFSIYNFYKQTTKHRVVLEQSFEKIHRIKVNSQAAYKEFAEYYNENWSYLLKDKDIIIRDFVVYFFQQCGQPIRFEKYGQPNKYRYSLESYMKNENPTECGLLFHLKNETPMNLRKIIKNLKVKYSQLIKTRVVFKNGIGKDHQISVHLVVKYQESLNFDIKIQELPPYSSNKCGQLNKNRVPLENYFNNDDINWHLKKIVMLNLQKVMKRRVAFEIRLHKDPFPFGHLHKNDNDLKFNQNNYLPATNILKNCSHSNENNETLELENSSYKQHQFHKNSSNKNGFRKQIIQGFINKAIQMELLKYANIAKQFQLCDSNNFYQLKSKQQTFFKKCQHILYSILFHCCCFCYWHIFGFPLVLEKIFKHLKDAKVHVLTQRFKIPQTTRTPKAASIYYDDGNIKVSCERKLKKLTKDNKDNQQWVLKNQTQAIKKETKLTTTFTPCEYTYSSCLTTSLTASSSYYLSYYKSLENLILVPNKAKQSRQPYCHYQQDNHHKYHHHHHYQHHRQKQETQQSQKQQQQRQKQQQQQHYKSNSTFHLRLPSLLVFSRTLIILILLSSLWHTSEGFHGSGVKLSTNTVKTKYGLVRGIVVRSSPSLVEAYLGIPYASPPVGSLRFMPPITPSTWKNVRNADRFSPVCPQNVPIPPNGPEALLEVPRARLAQLRRLLPLLSNQSEDCLYLNIYVPYENRRHRRFTTNSGESNDTPKLPTILFIHGESYEWNSGNPYDGSELAAHGNVIVVTINFRLGILGFLKTGGKESAQGNFGLMDLVAGLHWLKENLPAFGGDPQKITLLGHGTGAALANILVVSPVASDLVQHTVMVSGSALSPWAIQKNPLFVKRRVAEQTGCHGDMLYYDLAPCLRTKTVAELLAVKIDHPRFLVGFAPFIDGTVISPNTDSIGKLSLPLGSAIVSTSGIEYANFPKRNLIFCLTSVESHLDLSAQDLEFGFNETRRDRILRTYVRNNFHYHLNEIFAVLKNEYTEWDKAIRSPLSSRDATLQFLSDGHTASSLIKLGFMHSLRGGRGYFLHFKHRTLEEEYPQRTGSVRGEDVPFWLGLPISPLFPHNYTTQERQISRLMLRYLANFAKTGNPNQSTLSSPLPSSSALIGSPLLTPISSTSSVSSQTANDSHEKIKNSPYNIVNDTSLTSSGPNIVEDVATAAAREALNLAVLYNQRRSKRTFYKRHSRSNDDHSSSSSSEVNYFVNTNSNNNKLDNDEMPFWDAYDIVNQLYMELGNKAEIQSHYRGHKLSMWLNLIPQLHRHANMNDQSMRHHQFQDDLNNLNLYEGIVRAQMQTKPDDDDENLLLPRGRPTPPPPAQETNITHKSQGGTTECGVDGAMFVAEMSTLPPTDNNSLVLDSREKEMATASTGLIGNLEVLRRLSGKQFQSYTTALVATVAVGCFLLILNILIFAGIYHQREKRARDAKTKEELQDNDTSKNSSILKLNAIGSETGSFNGNMAGVSGKTTVVFGEYSCYDEKSLQTKDEKLIVELPPKQLVDANWASCSTSTLDLLKTKHHAPLDTIHTRSNVVPINTESQTEHLIGVNNLEMSTYGPLPMASGLIIDPSFTATSSSGLLSKRGSFVGSSGQLNQYDFASVQSSDQMSFKDIENAIKASSAMNDDITQDDDIPEPPPPPRSFQNMQQQQQQPAVNSSSGSGGAGGGGILRQAGTTSATQTGGGKKRVHIQEISV